MSNTSEEKAAAAVPASSESKPIENPMAVVVKGGTTTSRNDAMFAALYEDAEKRRDKEAAAKAAASVPIDQGGAVLLEHPLCAQNQQDIPRAWILLKYLNRRGEPLLGGNGKPVECLSDVVMDTSGEIIVILVCPQCIARGAHEDQAQIMLRNSNRRFHFTPAKGDPTFLFTDPESGETHMFQSAGVIEESERFTCPGCSWAARIDRNRVWPD